MPLLRRHRITILEHHLRYMLATLRSPRNRDHMKDVAGIDELWKQVDAAYRACFGDEDIAAYILPTELTGKEE